ncbi:type VI secretion system baseplate subunit TssG [Brucella cytisi]|uniref:Type VI secretion protein n=1 Tax=Brucella cytisi TaxID=407152 RepID=A0A1J6I1M0_9HYPH|nr:type VI secretion system baseplate subunit TssG [Brucella cytisi]OIS91662.1 type VI secretion protein [Brucella cytisi]
MAREPKFELIDLLEREPNRFDPVTALRVAQYSGEETQIQSHVGVSLGVFPVDNVTREQDTVRLRTTLAAISGPTGTLPPAYNEIAIKERRNRSHAFSAFIDLFNARLATLFADASEKYRFARLLRWRGSGKNAFITAILSLAGFGTARLVEESRVDQDVLLRYSGFFASRVRNGANLQALLADFSGLPIRIEQFRQRWLAVSTQEQTRPGKANCRLGVDSMAGSAILDRSSSFRVVIGPVGYDDYLSLRPDSRRIRELYAVTRLYAGDALTFDFQVILRKEDIPCSQLGNGTVRLGWNSWARIAPADRDSADAIIIPGPALLEDDR